MKQLASLACRTLLPRLGALLSAMTLLLGAPAHAETTLDVMYCYPSFARFHEPLAQEFMKLHPDITVKFRAPLASYDEGHQAMLRNAVTNQLPDVYYSGYHLLGELIHKLEARDQAVRIESLLKGEGDAFAAANFAPRLLALGQVDSRQYGLPFNASSPIMYVNADLVQKAGGDPQNMPTTWDGLIKLAGRIHALDKDINGLSYNIDAWPDDWLFQSIIDQQGGRMVKPGTKKAGFDGPVGLAALRTLRRLVTEGGMQMVDWDQSRQQFSAGKTGIFFSTPAQLRQVTDAVGSSFHFTTARFPLDDKTNGGVPTGGNAVILLAKDPAKQKAAWEFMKFVTSARGQKVVVEMTGYLPTNKLALGNDFLGPFYAVNPNFKTATTQIDIALPWSGYPGGQSVRIWRAQRDVIGTVMRGEKTPEGALPELIKVTEDLME